MFYLKSSSTNWTKSKGRGGFEAAKSNGNGPRRQKPRVVKNSQLGNIWKLCQLESNKHEDAAESMEASNHGERTPEMLGWLVIYKEATNSIIILVIQRNSPCNE